MIGEAAVEASAFQLASPSMVYKINMNDTTYCDVHTDKYRIVPLINELCLQDNMSELPMQWSPFLQNLQSQENQFAR